MRDATPRAAAEPTSVYRYYDQWDVLIYVGITGRGIKRNREHNRDKDWWPYVVRQEVEHLPTRQSALEREAALIGLHRPPFNTAANETWRASRQGYERLRARLAEVGSANDIIVRHKNRLPVDRVEDGFILDAEFFPVLNRLTLTPDAKVILPGGRVVGRMSLLFRNGPYGHIAAQVNSTVAERTGHLVVVAESVKSRGAGPLYRATKVFLTEASP